MNNREISVLKQRIYTCLSKRQLKDAFESLTQLVVNTQDWKISETLNELENNYKFMLHYIFEGVNDPEREKVYNNLTRQMYEITAD